MPFDVSTMWHCPHCGSLREERDGYLVCRNLFCNGCGTVIAEMPTIDDIPLATRLSKTGYQYSIAGSTSIFRYAKGRHKKALASKPGLGIIIAKVKINGKLYVRAFRRVKD